MNAKAGGGGEYKKPPSLNELLTLRTDYEDVPVPALGGATVRLFALSGLARARLVGEVRSILVKGGLDPNNMPDKASDIPDEVALQYASAIMQHQGRVVGASMGYPPTEWDDVADRLPGEAIETLYEVASRLSGLGSDEQEEEKDRQPTTRNAASGTD